MAGETVRGGRVLGSHLVLHSSWGPASLYSVPDKGFPTPWCSRPSMSLLQNSLAVGKFILHGPQLPF